MTQQNHRFEFDRKYLACGKLALMKECPSPNTIFGVAVLRHLRGKDIPSYVFLKPNKPKTMLLVTCSVLKLETAFLQHIPGLVIAFECASAAHSLNFHTSHPPSHFSNSVASWSRPLLFSRRFSCTRAYSRNVFIRTCKHVITRGDIASTSRYHYL